MEYAGMPVKQALIFAAGDPVLWDVAIGGDTIYEHPSKAYPEGRTVRQDYELRRYRNGRDESRRCAADEVTISYVSA